MNKPIYFIFGVHNHQPVGNFESVFEEAYQKAYAPFLEALSSHPKLQWNLHCTGILWEWLEKKHPEYLEKVKLLVGRGQLELLSGGFYEPILAILPDEDKIGQIQKLNHYLKQHFAVEPVGMWCAERIWEPHLPKPIQQAGIRYTVLDDAHFLSAGLSKNDLAGYYRVEEQNHAVDIFPISQELRYTIPFESPEKSIEILKFAAQSAVSQKSVPVLVMADDGEKFGLWPDTFKLVYEEGWLESFLTLLEKNSDWIWSATFSTVHRKEKPLGRIYLPVGSYFEMSEWSLPTEAGLEFEELLAGLAKEKDGARWKRFLKGGIWRNFLAKYPESNWMYKKMLRVSQKVHEAEKRFGVQELKSSRVQRLKNSSTLKLSNFKLISDALDHLWAGQCNCSYWHGVFGGLYLPILRQAIYKNLIEAEKKLDQLNLPSKRKNFKSTAIEVVDLDGDGWDEILMEDLHQNCYLAPASGGTLVEWDFKPVSLNLLNVLARRAEVYHKKIHKFVQQSQREGKEKSIHERVALKEKGLENLLTYDWYRRASMIDHFLHPATKMESFQRAQYGEQGDFVLGNYSAVVLDKNSVELSRNGLVWVNDKKRDLKITKIVTMKPSSGSLENKAELEILYRIHNLSGSLLLDLWFGSEFNFAFSLLDPEQDFSITGVQVWERKDPYLFWKISAHFSDSTDLWVLPLETVSNSEGGVEKTFQGLTFFPHWRFSLKEEETLERKMRLVVEKV